MSLGPLANLDPTAVTVWAATIGLFVLVALLRTVFKLNFSILTVLSLGLGIALSLVFNGQVDSLNLLGNIYINLITALVAPLIFVSIISSITYVGSLKKLRSIGLRSVGWLLLTNLIAIVMTLAVAIPLRIGEGVKLADDASTAGFLTSQTAPFDQVVLNFFPKNLFGDLAGNRVVPIIITATVLAVAIVAVSHDGRDVSIVRKFFEQTKDVIYKAVGYVVELTPYAVVVLGATSTAATTSKADALLALLGILLLGFALNFVQAFVVNGLLLKFVAKVSPIAFFKAVLPAQAAAFTTQSSVATLPLSIRQIGTVGVGADVANFTTPIGTTIGMPGCAGVWPMLSAVFTINALGLDYGPGAYAALALIGLLSSIGTAGVPGTAIVTATTVFTAVGLPVQLLVPLVPVSNIVGMPSTMANVSAAVTCAAVVARQTGEFDDGVLRAARRAACGASRAGGAGSVRPGGSVRRSGVGRHGHRRGVVGASAGVGALAGVSGGAGGGAVSVPVGVAADAAASAGQAGAGAAGAVVFGRGVAGGITGGAAGAVGVAAGAGQGSGAVPVSPASLGLGTAASIAADDAPVPVGACGVSGSGKVTTVRFGSPAGSAAAAAAGLAAAPAVPHLALKFGPTIHLSSRSTAGRAGTSRPALSPASVLTADDAPVPVGACGIGSH
ncbi:dicarboxylate/amino acid:cation symporter [Bifidobacterium leontopitheci]|uniref:L-cystine uptake protein TcyP n=1 Tax=Bifidobacterium leontopitheci TaxID=2650774 RepID=A0A6I1GKH1_9BIFI|nr:dicarboxylate/amino acid:cation symporter [Bifidobacterium leontopitheci]KAB7789867.1 sodium:dicarboxylate symporter [Bifidobacterium leontopitheci]